VRSISSRRDALSTLSPSSHSLRRIDVPKHSSGISTSPWQTIRCNRSNSQVLTNIVVIMMVTRRTSGDLETQTVDITLRESIQITFCERCEMQAYGSTIYCAFSVESPRRKSIARIGASATVPVLSIRSTGTLEKFAQT
jgi:hypothetical protein